MFSLVKPKDWPNRHVQRICGLRFCGKLFDYQGGAKKTNIEPSKMGMSWYVACFSNQTPGLVRFKPSLFWDHRCFGGMGSQRRSKALPEQNLLGQNRMSSDFSIKFRRSCARMGWNCLVTSVALELLIESDLLSGNLLHSYWKWP